MGGDVWPEKKGEALSPRGVLGEQWYKVICWGRDPETGGSSALIYLFVSLNFFSFVSSSFNRIDEKMSGGQSGYELSEAKAILTELKSIRKAISSGEKEKQDLMQVCRGVSVSICWGPGSSPYSHRSCPPWRVTDSEEHTQNELVLTLWRQDSDVLLDWVESGEVEPQSIWRA